MSTCCSIESTVKLVVVPCEGSKFFGIVIPLGVIEVTKEDLIFKTPTVNSKQEVLALLDGFCDENGYRFKCDGNYSTIKYKVS